MLKSGIIVFCEYSTSRSDRKHATDNCWWLVMMMMKCCKLLQKMKVKLLLLVLRYVKCDVYCGTCCRTQNVCSKENSRPDKARWRHLCRVIVGVAVSSFVHSHTVNHCDMNETWWCLSHLHTGDIFKSHARHIQL